MSMAKEIKTKTATEMALQLYPLVQEMLGDQLEHNQAGVLEAVYLLMQMMYGPSLAGRMLDASRGC